MRCPQFLLHKTESQEEPRGPFVCVKCFLLHSHLHSPLSTIFFLMVTSVWARDSHIGFVEHKAMEKNLPFTVNSLHSLAHSPAPSNTACLLCAGHRDQCSRHQLTRRFKPILGALRNTGYFQNLHSFPPLSYGSICTGPQQ